MASKQDDFGAPTQQWLAQDVVAVSIKPGTGAVQVGSLLAVGYAAQVAPVAQHMNLELCGWGALEGSQPSGAKRSTNRWHLGRARWKSVDPPVR